MEKFKWLLAAVATCGLASIAQAESVDYRLAAVVPIPATAANVQPGGAFTSFDIGYFDPVARNYYIADRSNASVDIISGTTLSVVGQATGFIGQARTTSVSGPDGVVAVTAGGISTLYAGDGNSTLKVFDVTNPSTPRLLQSISTGGNFRVDEMAYSAATHQLLAANNADGPAFATLFNAAGGGSPVSVSYTNIQVPGASRTDGMEQSVWNPNTGSFFLSVPSFGGDAAGGVVEIRTDGTIGQTYRFGQMGIASCGSAGLGLGASGNLMVGCSAKGTQTVLLNPTGSGSIVKTFAQVSGSDELWYDSGSHDFFVTGSDVAGHRVFGVISDVSGTFIGAAQLPVADLSNPHSIAVDPLTGNVYVPLAGNTAAVGGNTACEKGCVAVYVNAVPEPATYALTAVGLALLAGGAMRRGTKVSRGDGSAAGREPGTR